VRPKRPAIRTLSPASTPLTGLGLNLDRRALRTLLAGYATSRLSLGGRCGELRLLGLLGGGSFLLLVLALLDGGKAGGAPGLRAHRAALLDHIERGTNDGTLGLNSATSALLGDFL